MPALREPRSPPQRYADPIYGYCAMPKKPLIPYDPLAARSKTAHLDAEFRIPSRNASQIRRRMN